MINLNTNLSSLIAQSSMKTSTNKLNQAIERMSTGYKINHAKDNAANYSISTNMTTKIGALQIAEDNVLQGLDMINTASESLSLIEDKLMRLRALATQASNGTYGTQSKQAINAEANALVDEINRIYSNAEYNGVSMYDSAKGAGCDMEALPEVGASGFIKEIERRDTTNMKKFDDVAIDEFLTSGTYSISTSSELEKLATMTNNGLIGEDTEFVLANNIDLGGISNWTPIGKFNSNLSSNYETSFKAKFDGNGYIISNLKHDTSIVNYHAVGLFGIIDGANITNLGVENVQIDSTRGFIGVLVARFTNNSTIDNCFAKGTLSGVSQIGGLVGTLMDTCEIKNSYADVDITAKTSTTTSTLANYGGLVGASHGSIINCFATGDIVGCEDAFNLGGLVGCSSGLIRNCYSTGSVKGYSVIGGLVGWLPGHEYDKVGLVENCYSSGDVELIGKKASYSCGRAGGLFGSARESTIKNCSISGKVTTTMSDSYIIASIGTNYRSAIELYPEVELVNCTYDKSINPDLEVTQGSIICTNIFDSANIKEKVSVGLQIGINSDEASGLVATTSIKLSNLILLKNIGLDDDNYLSTVDNILSKVSTKQTEYGAVQNRLESALDEIATQYDNLVSSRSTLRDADLAEESSHYIQQQILQQASATLLATANQSPAIALQLI